jgi:hypothetical protein
MNFLSYLPPTLAALALSVLLADGTQRMSMLLPRPLELPGRRIDTGCAATNIVIFEDTFQPEPR